MKKTNISKFLSCILCFVLIAAMALTVCGCKDTETPASSAPISSDEATVLGEGETSFTFKVTANNETKVFTINTDEKTVGDALLKLDLIEGEGGDYGLYVKKVNGILADYDVDQTYWAFYINDEYAMSGVDTTEITADSVYEMRKQK